LEKLKLAELSTREGVIEAARMFVSHFSSPCIIFLTSYIASIYLVHDDAKEKEFELEMSWIGDETNGVHLPVPKDLFNEAESKAKAALENFE
jgi:20S proteasome subunit alpha 7